VVSYRQGANDKRVPDRGRRSRRPPRKVALESNTCRSCPNGRGGQALKNHPRSDWIDALQNHAKDRGSGRVLKYSHLNDWSVLSGYRSAYLHPWAVLRSRRTRCRYMQPSSAQLPAMRWLAVAATASATLVHPDWVKSDVLLTLNESRVSGRIVATGLQIHATPSGRYSASCHVSLVPDRRWMDLSADCHFHW
jgi:hypothetical protein